MNIVFHNRNCKLNVTLEYADSTYSIQPGQSLELPFFNNTATFSVTMDNLSAEELGFDKSAKGLKNKIFNKLANKAAEAVSKIALNSRVTYEFVGNNTPVIDLDEEHWSEFDGDVAMFLFESTPVLHRFCRAESYNGTLKVVKTENTNLKAFLKIIRGWLLFVQWGSLLINFILFMPYYTIIRFLSSDFHFSTVLKRLYKMSPDQRQTAIQKNDEKQTEIDTTKGCLKFALKITLAVVAVIIIANLIIRFI